MEKPIWKINALKLVKYTLSRISNELHSNSLGELVILIDKIILEVEDQYGYIYNLENDFKTSFNITYVDYNDLERTEDYYFNLSKAELMEMELGIAGGLSETIDKIIKTKDTPSLVKIFKELLLKAYGVKSPDGKRFIKSDELRDEF